MLFRRCFIVLSLIALAALACTPAPSGGGNGNDNDSGGALTGELVYFSGRPPPKWTIPSGEHADPAQRLTGLTAAAEPAEFPRLEAVAYGILNAEGVAGIPDEVLVQEGIIEIRTGASLLTSPTTSNRSADPGAKTERRAMASFTARLSNPFRDWHQSDKSLAATTRVLEVTNAGGRSLGNS